MKSNSPALVAMIIAAATLFAGIALAGPLEDGNAAYREKDYAKAVELWQPLAERGDPMAQYYLGTLYAEGNGVDQDDEAAFKLFLRSANRGNAAVAGELIATNLVLRNPPAVIQNFSLKPTESTTSVSPSHFPTDVP